MPRQPWLTSAVWRFTHPVFVEGVTELRAVVDGLRAYGVPESDWRVNLAIARGLDYYTGTVYETFLADHRAIGSVCSGGRYDNLASLYSKATMPGVGISIGLTRLFYALQQAGEIDDSTSTVQVLVTQMDPALKTEYASIGRELREAGFNTEVHLESAKLGKQLAYADRIGARLAVIVGAREHDAGTVTVKDLRSGEQRSVERADLVDALRPA